jgi:hypothetical protein
VFRREFKAGQTPSFDLKVEKESPLPDGQYQYELRLIPDVSQEVKETLQRAREDGNSAGVEAELRSSGLLPVHGEQSGAFQVRGGAIVAGSDLGSSKTDGGQSKPGGGTPPNGGIRPQDVVTPDDIIVQGSICTGFDCVNNENFGFDTIKLKENNLRIKFEDTSVGTFPSTDWQLTANDSASGGANRFSIEDTTAVRIPFTITGGAVTNSIFVASNGKVGFRTSTPVLDLHANTNDTPALRFEQNNSGGFTAQTWDVAGNEANFFVRDVTSGSRLPFRIRPGAPTSSLDIAFDGNVGLGTQAPGGSLHIGNNGPQWSSFNYGSNVIIKDGTTARNPAIGIFDSTNANPWAIVNVAGALRFNQMPALGNTASAPTERVIITTAGNVGIGTTAPAGKLDVNGTIFQRGLLLHADYVFEPEYNLESIEEHDQFMWTNKHLPAVGARTVDESGREVVEIGSRMRGLLEELEKAHIYISTLNGRVADKEAQLAKLAQQNSELAERLTRIEALLSVSKTGTK